MRVMDLLNWAARHLEDHRVEHPRLNAELLLAHALTLRREGLYIHLNDPLSDKTKSRLEELVQRRISGEPLQYILGKQEFWSFDFRVDPRVLIPRPETEILVEQSLSTLSAMAAGKTPLVLEIGTGSGAVAISLVREVKDILMVATDISREALFLAKENAREMDVLHRIAFVNGDLFGPFHSCEEGLFDLILSNPPYISRLELKRLAREIRDHEPTGALNGGEDGLDFYRGIARQAPSYLRRGGWLLLELGQGQCERITEFLREKGEFSKPEFLKDFSGIERVVKAQKKTDFYFPPSTFRSRDG
jgi:release factor glutamine methyltransferase